MNKNEILDEINGTMAELLQQISSFEKEQVNVIPFEGSWTAGQLAQHLVMSGTGFVEILNGPVKDAERAPDEKIEKIKTVFLDFSTKMKSPDFIVPPTKTYNKDELLNSLKRIQASINKAIETLDLAKTCIAFELPAMGFLTRLEAISFVLYHTKRHIHQLKNIHQEIVNHNPE